MRRRASTAADLIDHTTELGGTTVLGGISAFGVDAAGELYVVNHSSGTILRIVGAPARADQRPHRSLSFLELRLHGYSHDSVCMCSMLAGPRPAARALIAHSRPAARTRSRSRLRESVRGSGRSEH